MKVQSNNLLTELTLMGIAKENKLNYIVFPKNWEHSIIISKAI